MKIQERLCQLKEMRLLLDRDTIIDKDICSRNIRVRLLKQYYSQRKTVSDQGDYAIIYNTLQKDPTNSEKEAVEHIYRQLRNAEPPDEETARGIIR